MFDIVRLNLAGQWHTPSLGEIAELLVFYDQVEIRAPVSRLASLMPSKIDDLRFIRELVEQQKISILIDQTPLGEVAFEMGLLGNPLKEEIDPAETRARLRDAYLEYDLPLNSLLALDSADVKPWRAEWDRILSLAVNPMQRDAAYVDELIANAKNKIPLIAQQEFLDAALQSYSNDSRPETRKALRQMTTREVEFEGSSVIAFNTEWLKTSAQMLEFLSQADILLSNVDGQEGVDDCTFPAFDKWTRQLISGSLSRAGVREELEAFQTSVLGASTIADAIDRKMRSFRDLEGLLVTREPFAKAVRGRPTDTSLTKAYFEEIQKTSWFTHGPGKIVRFSLFTGAGILTGVVLTPVAGAAVGIGLNAIDSFVLDKLLKGNACRSFVEEGLQPFVNDSN